VKAEYGVTDRLAHPLDLMLAALVQDQLQNRRTRAPAENTSLRGGGATVVELDSLAERGERSRVGHPRDLGLVHLRNPVARMRETMRERTVVREQEGPRRIGVEASHRHDSRRALDEVDDRRAAVWIARCRDHARRFVEKNVGERLRRDPLSVDLDDVSRSDDRVQLSGLAVHAHATGKNQLVSAAPRRNTGPSEECVQPHCLILS